MFNWFSKNKAKPEEVTPEALQTQQALEKTRTGFLSKLSRLFTCAAAVEQLTIWQNRAGVSIVSHGMNTDPASVAFDAVKKAVEENADVVIIDTAGRLHNKVGLMNELSKIRRVIEKFKPDAPHEVLLVIDATTGQNAFEQAKQFTAATQVNTLAVTKLDGTAKGGVVIGVSHAYNLPVKYIGLGEKAEDLKLFNKYDFIKSIFVS